MVTVTTDVPPGLAWVLGHRPAWHCRGLPTPRSLFSCPPQRGASRTPTVNAWALGRTLHRTESSGHGTITSQPWDPAARLLCRHQPTLPVIYPPALTLLIHASGLSAPAATGPRFRAQPRMLGPPPEVPTPSSPGGVKRGPGLPLRCSAPSARSRTLLLGITSAPPPVPGLSRHCTQAPKPPNVGAHQPGAPGCVPPLTATTPVSKRGPRCSCGPGGRSGRDSRPRRGSPSRLPGTTDPLTCCPWAGHPPGKWGGG